MSRRDPTGCGTELRVLAAIAGVCALFAVWCEVESSRSRQKSREIDAFLDQAAADVAAAAVAQDGSRLGNPHPVDPMLQSRAFELAVTGTWQGQGRRWKLFAVGISRVEELVVVTYGDRRPSNWEGMAQRLGRRCFDQVASVKAPLPVKLQATGEPGAKPLAQTLVRRPTAGR